MLKWVYKFFKYKPVRYFTSYIPIIILTVLVTTTLYYYYIDRTPYKIYYILSSHFSSGTLITLFAAMFVFSLRMCIYTQIAILGILYYNLINSLYYYSEFYGWHIHNNAFVEAFEFGGITIALILSLIYLIRSFNEGKGKSGNNHESCHCPP